MRMVLLFLVIMFFWFLPPAQAENHNIDKWNRYIEAKSRSVVGYYNRGNGYGKLKQYDRAIQDYSKAIKLKPGYAKAYYNRGVVYSKLKQYLNSDIRIKRETVLPKKILRVRIRNFQLTAVLYTWHRPVLW